MAIATLSVDLVARIGAFISGLKQAESQASTTSNKIKSELGDTSSTSFSKMGAGFMAVGGAAVAAMTAIAGATAAAVAQGVAYSGQLVDTAERLGMTTTSVQGLFGALGQLGFSTEESTGIFEKLQKAMVEAQDPASKAAEAFAAIGVSAEDLKNKSLEEIFRAVVDGTSQLADRTDRAAISMELFGKSGLKMGEVMTGGLSVIDEAIASFNELGILLEDDTVRAANSVGDQLDVMGTAMNALSTQITGDLAPTINGLIQQFVELVGQFIESGNASMVVEQGLAIIDAAIGTTITVINGMMAVWYQLQSVVQGVIGRSINNVMSFVQTLGVLGDVIGKVFSGQFGAAASAAKSGWAQVQAAHKGGAAAVEKSVEEYAQKSLDSFNRANRQMAGQGFTLANYLGGGTAAAQAERGTKGSTFGTATATTAGGGGGGRSRGGGGGRSSRESDGAREAARALQEAQRAAEALQKSYDDQLLSYEQSMFMLGKSGETATIQWEIAKGKFKDLDQAQKDNLLTQAQALDAAQKQHELDEEKRKNHEDDMKRAKEFTEELEFQMSIYGKTADEIERANLARDLGTALETEVGQKALETLDAYQKHVKEQDQVIEAMDSVRDAAGGFFKDVITGSKSFKDAAMDALDSIFNKLLDMVVQNLVGQLFGQMGTSGGGLFGDIVGTAVKGMGFGRAVGGGVSSGMFYRINENGPEILSVGGADYLMMGDQSGNVRPNRGGVGGGSTTINFAVQGKIDRRTEHQIANETSRQLAMSRARS